MSQVSTTALRRGHEGTLVAARAGTQSFEEQRDLFRFLLRHERLWRHDRERERATKRGWQFKQVTVVRDEIVRPAARSDGG